MEELEADTVQLMHKRVYDLAGVLGKGTKVSTYGMSTVRDTKVTPLGMAHE